MTTYTKQHQRDLKWPQRHKGNDHEETQNNYKKMKNYYRETEKTNKQTLKEHKTTTKRFKIKKYPEKHGKWWQINEKNDHKVPLNNCSDTKRQLRAEKWQQKDEKHQCGSLLVKGIDSLLILVFSWYKISPYCWKGLSNVWMLTCQSDLWGNWTETLHLAFSQRLHRSLQQMDIECLTFKEMCSDFFIFFCSHEINHQGAAATWLTSWKRRG